MNGEQMQKGRTGDMIFTVPQLIEFLSSVLPLLPGDLIFTGTPSGMGWPRTTAATPGRGRAGHLGQRDRGNAAPLHSTGQPGQQPAQLDLKVRRTRNGGAAQHHRIHRGRADHRGHDRRPSGPGDGEAIAALHGGTYTARYFDVAGSPHGTFMDLAAVGGYPVVSFDRPGYGGSPALDPAHNTFDRHAQLLAEAIAQAAGPFSADSVFLVGHSIGGMIAMMIAAGDVAFRLTGLSVTGMGAVIRPGGPAQALASLPPDETVDLPYDQRDLVMFGRNSPAARKRCWPPTPLTHLCRFVS